jgi:dTDP-4-amino-4,6-dideoxygalactose transaminase
MISPETKSLLAFEGGTPEITETPSELTGRWGEADRLLVEAALRQDSLFYWQGPQTKLLVERFQKHYPLKHVMPCSSGTAALHIAVAAAGIKPGDEVIVPPITDMGSVIGILFQLGVPVFADVEPHTYNLDPVDVRRKVTSKTRAILTVHLAGNACRVEELRVLADELGLVLIEDCAQAWGSLAQGRPVGTIGHIGCFSFNDFKHLSCGDGGIVASSDPTFGPKLQGFGDKGYNRVTSSKSPSILATNYRITELQSAVAAAQLERIGMIARRRNKLGSRLGELLKDMPGIHPHEVTADTFCTYWFYLLRFDEAVMNCDRARFVKALQAEGADAHEGYLASPLYKYDVFRNHSFFAGEWPLRTSGMTDMNYRDVCCPNAEAVLQTCIFVKLHEQMDDEYIEGLGRAFRKVAAHFVK